MRAENSARGEVAWKRFEHPVAFWTGTIACAVGVGLHLPMYYSARDMGYRMAGMRPDTAMIIGMVSIFAGLIAAFYGLVPAGAERIRAKAASVRVTALDDAPLLPQHVAMLLVISIAIVIDVMKPAALAFVAPGMAKEYGLRAATNPHGHIPVVNGHEVTLLGGQRMARLADSGSPGLCPRMSRWAAVGFPQGWSGQRDHPLAGQGLGEAVRIPGSQDEMRVVQ